jgi:hypothetical protein
MPESVGESLNCKFEKEADPKLRHEFVGMMFAVTVAEIGLQVASLVQQKSFGEYLPAYSHLFLATIVVATSWVGWTLSRSPGARHDVTKIFQVEFVVLLIDVALVICYFVLVRSVEFDRPEKMGALAFKASTAKWLRFIFVLYFCWDLCTKGYLWWKHKTARDLDRWCPNYCVRFIPTLICLGLAWWVSACVSDDWQNAQVVLADGALIAVVLLFRSTKELASAFFPSKGNPGESTTCPLIWTTIFLIGFALMLVWASQGPPKWLGRILGSQAPAPKLLTD